MLSRSTPFGALGDRLSIPSSTVQPFAGFKPAPPYLFHRIEDPFTRRPDAASSRRHEAAFDVLATEDSSETVFTEAELRGIHRSIYAAFDRKPDAARIIQGVREFRKGRPHVRIIMHPSPKNGGAFIPCEGRLEAKAAVSFDIDPSVRRYRGQPFEIKHGPGFGYVPDFVVEHYDGTFTVVDVKPVGRLLSPDTTARMTYVRRVLRLAGLRHRLCTEVELEKQPALQIREALRQGVRVELTALDRERLLSLLGNEGLTVREFRDRAVVHGFAPLVVEKLALLGDITFPITTQWSVFAHLEVSNGTDQAVAAGWGTVRDVRITV